MTDEWILCIGCKTGGFIFQQMYFGRFPFRFDLKNSFVVIQYQLYFFEHIIILGDKNKPWKN